MGPLLSGPGTLSTNYHKLRYGSRLGDYGTLSLVGGAFALSRLCVGALKVTSICDMRVV